MTQEGNTTMEIEPNKQEEDFVYDVIDFVELSQKQGSESLELEDCGANEKADAVAQTSKAKQSGGVRKKGQRNKSVDETLKDYAEQQKKENDYIDFGTNIESAQGTEMTAPHEAHNSSNRSLYGVELQTVVVAGDKSVGKTSLLLSHAQNKFLTDYDPTQGEDCFSVEELSSNQIMTLKLWDTGGAEACDVHRLKRYPQADLIVVCFSIADPSSYDNVGIRWHQELALNCPNKPVVLLGTKIDLRNDPKVIKALGRYNLAPISPEQGVALAKKIGAIKYLECSAKGRIKLKDTFSEIRQLILSSAEKAAGAEVGSPHETQQAASESTAEPTDLKPRSLTKPQVPPKPKNLALRWKLKTNTKKMEGVKEIENERSMPKEGSEEPPASASQGPAQAVMGPQTKSKALCLVININKYEVQTRFNERVGSHKDVARIQDVFSRLGFEVRVHEDLKCYEISKLLSETALSEELSEFEYFVCFIMAHGDNGIIYGSDGDSLEIPVITGKFRSNECPSLRDRAKLFFFQACRGTGTDNALGAVVDSLSEFQASNNLYCPKDSDFLICYANTEGCSAFRDEVNGSPFVQTMCDVVEEKHMTEDIMGMMRQVNKRLKRKPVRLERGEFYSVPELRSTLSMKCFLQLSSPAESAAP